MDEESDFRPNQCGRRVDGGVDRISELPDEIVVVILSFLSLRRAVTTSVLSSRWSDLWKHTPNLDFDCRILACDDDIPIPDHDDDPSDFDDDILDTGVRVRGSLWDEKRFRGVVNSVIQSHEALSLKSFRINLPVNTSASLCAVTKWLEFVFSRQVESLDLNFICGNQSVLGELLRESRICLQPQTDLIFFQSLKRLRLGCLKVSGEDIEFFLRNCPLLEQLTILMVNLTSDVELCGANLMLKHLEIFWCKGPKSIKVSAPNLTYIRFADEGGKLLFENAPKLVEAEFYFNGSDNVVQRFASLASCYFSQLQILNLNLFKSKTLCQLPVILANGFTQMPNLKKLVILCYKMYNHILPATALIWAFPCIEEFKLTHISDLHEEEAAYMQVMTDVGRYPHQHLKVFELQMYSLQNVDGIVELVTYISNNCVALRKVIIDHWSTLVDPVTRDFITQQLQGKVPNHIQLELFNSSL